MDTSESSVSESTLLRFAAVLPVQPAAPLAAPLVAPHAAEAAELLGLGSTRGRAAPHAEQDKPAPVFTKVHEVQVHFLFSDEAVNILATAGSISKLGALSSFS